MFCEKCGNQLPESAMFCDKCGASTQLNVKVQEKIVDNEVQLNVKPVFSLGYLTLPTIVVYWIPVIIISIIIAMANSAAGIGMMILGLIGFLIFGLFWGIGLVFKKMQYDNYSYSFYKTKVIYKDGFLNKSEKEVKYKYIREVGMRQTFFQRFFNLGNIILYTNAETGLGNGIFILNIRDVQETYQKIKSIIDV